MNFKMDEVPVIRGELLEVSPIKVSGTEEFERLRDALVAVAEQVGPMLGSIQDESDYKAAIAYMEKYRALSRQINESIRLAGKQLEEGQLSLQELQKQLLNPALQVTSLIHEETNRFAKEQHRIEQEKLESMRLKEQAESDKKQRQEDLLSLRAELAGARQVADNAERAGELETATEIRRGLQRFNALDAAPQSFANPKHDVSQVRMIVASALFREQERRQNTSV